MPSDRKSSTEPKRKTAEQTKQGGKDKDMGAALRSVYQKTVNEAIPDEMLDLLGKLG
ncbi:NepR family anti-sigma factor [Hephaestia mangrovi]|uniref:NepR family anti-sigma factor n=1 Tax=Hephaestia mangrovi TaxID=2873268 RepID=UPI0021055750|nr:NepR family anti-sigma factor [Hephaestia mangrovi]